MAEKIAYFRLGKMWDPAFKDERFYIIKNAHPSGRLHWHDCFEIEIITKGSCKEILNGGVIPVTAGDAILVTPTDLHELRELNDLELYNVMFDTEIIDHELLNKILLNGDGVIQCRLNDEDFKYALTVLDYACRRFRKNEPDYERFVNNAVNQLLSIMLCQTEKIISKDKNLSIRTAAFYIKMHFREKLSLKEAAQSANLDEAYFSVKFHEVMGVTFKKYLNDIRLNCAGKALISTELSVADICYESGFESLPHFYREFKKKYGVSPLEFRNHKKGSEIPKNK